MLFRFTPCGVPSVDNDSSKKTDGTSVPLLRSSSISEGDFQASSSLASPTVSTVEGVQPTAVQDQNVCAHGKSGHKSSTESLSSQAAEPASPSTFPRKAPFSRSRLRLLSCRSIEEPHMTSSVKDRYPIIKHILNFIRDQALTTARCVTTTSLLCCDFFFFQLCNCFSSDTVKSLFSSLFHSILQTLSLSRAQALSVCKVLGIVQQCLHSLGKPHLFQAPCILFLQELLACQKDFTKYN